MLSLYIINYLKNIYIKFRKNEMILYLIICIYHFGIINNVFNLRERIKITCGVNSYYVNFYCTRESFLYISSETNLYVYSD